MDFFRIKLTSEDFFIFTFLSFIFCFSIPGVLYLIYVNSVCNIEVADKIFLVSILSAFVGILFNYFVLQFNFFKKFLFSITKGDIKDRKELAIYFVYGGFFSYVPIFLFFTINLVLFLIYSFNRKIKKSINFKEIK